MFLSSKSDSLTSSTIATFACKNHEVVLSAFGKAITLLRGWVKAGILTWLQVKLEPRVHLPGWWLSLGRAHGPLGDW